MDKMAEKPVYTWRIAPTSPNLLITKFESGLDLGEGPSWRAIFSVRVRDGLLTKAIEATYGGTGGSIDTRAIAHGTSKAAKMAAGKVFDQAWVILVDLAKRTKHAQQFDIDTAVEILIDEMVGDHQTDQKIHRRLLRGNGRLVGINKDRTLSLWSKQGQSHAAVKAVVVKAGAADGVVEWAHETLICTLGPKPHPLPPYVDNLYQPPADSPCVICGEMIDRKQCGTKSRTCCSIMCDCLNQEVLHGARSMVMNGIERPEAHLPYMPMGLGGYGSQGPIGSMIRLAIEINHHEWPSASERQKAIYVLQRLNEAYRILHHILGEAAAEMHKPLEIPTMEEMQVLSDKFPAMLEEALKEERLRKDDDD